MQPASAIIENVLPIATQEQPPNPRASQAPMKSPDVSKRRRWLDKWINLQNPTNHPQLSFLKTALWSFCADYAKRPGSGRRLFLHGNNGCGKTHSAKAVYRWAGRLAIDLPLQLGDAGARLTTSEFLHWPSLMRRERSEIIWRIDEAGQADLLVLDDIGAEHDPWGMAKAELYTLMERRQNRWTLFTSNLPPSSWEAIDRRIASRFLRNCDVVDLSEVEDWGTR